MVFVFQVPITFNLVSSKPIIHRCHTSIKRRMSLKTQLHCTNNQNTPPLLTPQQHDDYGKELNEDQALN